MTRRFRVDYIFEAPADFSDIMPTGAPLPTTWMTTHHASVTVDATAPISMDHAIDMAKVIANLRGDGVEVTVTAIEEVP